MPGIQEAKAEREPQIQNYLSRLECAVKELGESVASLEQRFSSVLQGKSPNVTGVPTAKDPEALCETASRLRTLLDGITSTEGHVREIRSRVEA